MCTMRRCLWHFKGYLGYATFSNLRDGHVLIAIAMVTPGAFHALIDLLSVYIIIL